MPADEGAMLTVASVQGGEIAREPITIGEGLLLGVVQGLTEFLPISSSAHMRVVPAFITWPDPGAAVSAVIQLGTVLSLLVIPVMHTVVDDVVRWIKVRILNQDPSTLEPIEAENENA